MKKIILSISILALFTSCKKEEKSAVKTDDTLQTENSEPVVDDTLDPKTFCYLAVVSQDSVFINFDDNLGTIIGKMKYKHFEKDNSFGEVSGFKSGDTLKLTFEFSSEGATSKRDIFLLQKDDELIEGIGTVKNEDGHVKYSNESKITYNTGLLFEKYDCDKVNKALKEAPKAKKTVTTEEKPSK